MSVYQRLHFRILGILGIGLPSDQLHNQPGWRPHKKVTFAEEHDYIYIYDYDDYHQPNIFRKKVT